METILGRVGHNPTSFRSQLGLVVSIPCSLLSSCFLVIEALSTSGAAKVGDIVDPTVDLSAVEAPLAITIAVTIAETVELADPACPEKRPKSAVPKPHRELRPYHVVLFPCSDGVYMAFALMFTVSPL